MVTGNRLIVRNGGEVLIPKSAREEIIRTLHITHPATETMCNQTKNKIFWPKIRNDLERYYEACESVQFTETPDHKKAMIFQRVVYLRISIQTNAYRETSLKEVQIIT